MIPIRTSVEVREIPGAVIGLILANVAVFTFQSGLDDDLAKQFIYQNGLLPARYSDPDVARELGLSPFNYLPFLTSVFMHGGWLHLAVNMWTLWLFGRALEERLGAPRFVLFYLACGLIAGLTHFAFNLDSAVPALGASGAIAGVLGAYTMVHPTARVAIVTPILFFPVVFHLPAVVYTTLWFVFQVARGIAEFSLPAGAGGIAWWAHIGGFVAGLALIGAIGRQRRRVREIGDARPGVREIGAPRPRVVKVGTQPRRLRSAGAFGRWKERLGDNVGAPVTALAREIGPSVPRRERHEPVAPPPIPASKENIAIEGTRQDDRRASATRPRDAGRSIIPQAGGQEAISEQQEREALALIEALLAAEASPEMVDAWEGYKRDIANGEFGLADLTYLRDLHAHLGEER